MVVWLFNCSYLFSGNFTGTESCTYANLNAVSLPFCLLLIEVSAIWLKQNFQTELIKLGSFGLSFFSFSNSISVGKFKISVIGSVLKKTINVSSLLFCFEVFN